MPLYGCVKCRAVFPSPGVCRSCGRGLLAFQPQLQPKQKLLKAIGPPTFPVNAHSMGLDLRSLSSDFPLRNVAVQLPPPVGNLGQIEYARNPTARPMHRAIRAPGPSSPEHTLHPSLAFPAEDTEVMFVVTRDGELIFGTRPEDVRRPHPTLVGEVDPEILSGGTITMRDGLIYEIRNDSGHHQPSYSATESLLKAFSRLPRSVFHGGFQGFKPFGAPAIIPEFARATPRNERIHTQTTMCSRAQRICQDIVNRIRSDRAILANPRARMDLIVILDRHDRILHDAATLLGEMIDFAHRHPIFADPLQVQRAISGARGLQQNILRIVNARVRSMDDSANLFRDIQAVFAFFRNIPILHT